MRRLSLVAMFVFMSLIVGCAHYPGGIAPSTTPLEGRKYTVLGHTVAKDSKFSLFGIFPLTGSNTIREAVEEATARGKGDAMINVTVEYYSQFWIILSRDVIVVEGEAIKFTD